MVTALSSANYATYCACVGTLGEFVKTARAERGVSQTELADELGMSRAHLAQIERGKIALPNADIRRRLAKALGVSHLDLLVAAGEITPQELGTVAGVVERDPDDPRAEFHELLDRVRLDRQRVSLLRDILTGMVRYDEGENER